MKPVIRGGIASLNVTCGGLGNFGMGRFGISGGLGIQVLGIGTAGATLHIYI